MKFDPNIDINKCIYCGKCLYRCPLYERYKDQVISVRGKIIALREGLKDERLLISSYCGICVEECPLKIDISGYLLLKYWPKQMPSPVIKDEMEGIFEISSSGEWRVYHALEEYADELRMPHAVKYRVKVPFIFLFLKKYEEFLEGSYSVEFTGDSSLKLPSYMNKYIESDIGFKEVFYYEK